MKKTALVLAITALFAASVFAGMTTYTKELALTAGMYGQFGVLTPGSLSTIGYLPTDLNVIGNAVALEYDDGSGDAFVSVMTGIGLVGITLDNSRLNLHYSTTGSDLRLGGTLMLGVDNSSYENKQVVANPDDPDKAYSNEINTGVVFDIDMPKSNMTFMGYFNVTGEYDIDRDYDNTANVLISDSDDAQTDWTFVAGARLGIGGFTVVPMAGYMLDTYVNRNWTDINMDGTKEVNTVTTYGSSGYTAGVIAGRDFQVTDIIKVKGGAALLLSGDLGHTTKTENKVADTVTYNTTNEIGYSMYVPMFVGIEAKLNDTWTLYSSAGTMGINMGSETDQFNQEISAASFVDYQVSGGMSVDPYVQYAIGLNMTVGDFKLDVVLDPTIFTYGLFAVTGDTTDSGDLAYRVAASYSWK